MDHQPMQLLSRSQEVSWFPSVTHWRKRGNAHIVNASFYIPTWPCEPVGPLHPKRQQCQRRNSEPRTHSHRCQHATTLPGKLSQFIGKTRFSNTTFVTSVQDVKRVDDKRAGSTATGTKCLGRSTELLSGAVTTGIKTRRLSARRSQATRHERATRVTHPFNKYISDQSRQEDNIKLWILITYE